MIRGGGGEKKKEKYISKLKDNAVGNTLKVWDLQNNEHIFENHSDLRKYYESIKDEPGNEEMIALLKSVERVFMLRYLVDTSNAQYKVETPIFMTAEQLEKARAKKANDAEEDMDSDDEEEEISNPVTPGGGGNTSNASNNIDPVLSDDEEDFGEVQMTGALWKKKIDIFPNTTPNWNRKLV